MSELWWLPYIPLIFFLLLLLSDRDAHARSIVRYTTVTSLAALISFLVLLTTSTALITPTVKYLFYIIGYYAPWSGLFWREITILHDSLEGKMIKQPDYPARGLRLFKSTVFRLGQVSPMIIWMIMLRIMSSNMKTITDLLGDLNLWLFVSILVACAIILALIEHYWLWIDSPSQTTSQIS